ncbi:tautomerase family protein [Shinella zoogloeoides]|uniref:tautomerase family protein n=1 Tax=Shinella zoogloeoides TaxID=352475 RepID=UPI0028B18B66|nr:tautomerase family protein [Shinella zoogloeoides]
MPLVKIHMIEGRTQEEITTILDALHRAVVESFDVPEDDRYQLVLEYPADHLRALDTGLGFTRTKKFVLIEVVSRPRTRAQKEHFYENASSALLRKCHVGSTDVMFTFVTNSDEDWSFGLGQAQFLTGAL